MENQTSFSPLSDSQPSVPAPLPSRNPKPNFLVWIAAGVATLAIGIGIGLAVGKYSTKPNKPLTSDQSSPQISSYDDCVKAKDSIVSRSYPSVCITASGQRFTQPLTDEEKQNLQPSDPDREPTGSAATADWKTHTNSVYLYSINAPPDFVLQLCSDCQPPEVNFSLQNSSGSISLGAEYAHQYSLTGNLSSKAVPTHNLKITIQGKSYTPEEYYVTGEKYNYIFKIDDVSKNGQPSQISLSGGYTRLEEAQLVSQILSTFRFAD